MGDRWLLLNLMLALVGVSMIAGDEDLDENGYIMFCPCMGKKTLSRRFYSEDFKIVFFDIQDGSETKWTTTWGLWASLTV